MPGGEAILLDAVLGVAKTAAGTRVVAGNAGGAARLYALTMAGVEGFQARAGPRVIALVDRGGDAVLIAGPPGNAAGVHAARAGGPRGVSARQPEVCVAGARARRAAGRRCRRRTSCRPTWCVAAAGGKDLFVGSAQLGVARATPDGARFLPGSQLVGDAQPPVRRGASRARAASSSPTVRAPG